MIQVTIKRLETRDIAIQVAVINESDGKSMVINHFDTNKLGSKLHWVIIEIMSRITYAIEEYLA